jgi:hypothetical protein
LPQVFRSFVALQDVEVRLKALNFGERRLLLAEVESKGYGVEFEKAPLLALTVSAQVVKEVVFLCELSVVLEVIHQLFLPMAAQVIKPYTLRKRHPFEIVECLRTLNLLPIAVAVVETALDDL